jgi:hypothetical protein
MPSAGTELSTISWRSIYSGTSALSKCALSTHSEGGNAMNWFTKSLAIMLLPCLATVSFTVDAIAQEKQQLSSKTSAENTRYTQQHMIDVGDFPGHQVRVYEIHRTFPSNAPVINGVAIKEQWTRGISDYTDNNGPGTTYGVYVLENGDKFFTRSSLVAQSTGSGKLTASTVGYITGGIGKFTGIKGIVRTVNTADPKAGVNVQTEIEYTIAK